MFKKQTIDKNILEIISKIESNLESKECDDSFRGNNMNSFKLISPLMIYSIQNVNCIMNNSKNFLVYFSTFNNEEEGILNCNKHSYLFSNFSKSSDQNYSNTYDEMSNIACTNELYSKKIRSNFNEKSCFKFLKSYSNTVTDNKILKESFSEQILNDIFVKSTNYPKSLLNIKGVIK